MIRNKTSIAMGYHQKIIQFTVVTRQGRPIQSVEFRWDLINPQSSIKIIISSAKWGLKCDKAHQWLLNKYLISLSSGCLLPHHKVINGARNYFGDFWSFSSRRPFMPTRVWGVSLIYFIGFSLRAASFHCGQTLQH